MQRPVPGGLVLVTYFDGNHEIHTQPAHVLSVGATDDPSQLPSITVVYPRLPLDIRQLTGPDWQKAFIRSSAVPHKSDDAVANRTASICWHEATDPEMWADEHAEEMTAPEGESPASRNSRPVAPEALTTGAEAPAAVQMGTVPDTSVLSPAVNEIQGASDPTQPSLPAMTSGDGSASEQEPQQDPSSDPAVTSPASQDPPATEPTE